jgi:pimeloyl-ACP methyl ester carboxylesterase
MKVYEFGKEHAKSFVMFQCAVEPWWVFKASAEEMARDYHVYLFIADGHDALGTEFVSLEKYAKDAAEYLRAQGACRVAGMYGVSMGGAAVIRFLATETSLWSERSSMPESRHIPIRN